MEPQRETPLPESSERAAVEPYVIDLARSGSADLARVGGKNASLGELFRHLAPAGVRVPRGFATTAQAYREFLAKNDLVPAIARYLAAKYGGAGPHP